jgi:hypothetical protein
MLNQLWESLGYDGLWDFGAEIASCGEFPLSDSWRHEKTHKLDYSTCVLVLLRRYFD